MKNKNTSKINYYPSALTIAGSDSSGGAGIQADLRTFNAYAVYGTSAITAITAQNIAKVADVHFVPAQTVASQIDTVLESVPLTFAKSGMLGNSEIVRAVADAVRRHNLKLVVDPVMISTSGKSLLAEDACEVLKDELLTQAFAVTPNIPEAEALLGCRIKDEKSLFDAAGRISEMFNTLCVLKGGHLESNKYAVDAVAFENRLYQLRSPMLKNCRHTHGTGCTFSAAFCANLALGVEWDDALLEAKTFVFGSIAEPVRLGNNTEVMYPPETDYSEHISLLEI